MRIRRVGKFIMVDLMEGIRMNTTQTNSPGQTYRMKEVRNSAPNKPKKKVHRVTEFARRIKNELIEKLGGKCRLCGVAEGLEFDHIYGRSYDPNKLSYACRLKRYQREAELDQIRLLCGPCNKEERKKNDNGQFIRTEHASLVPLTKDLPF